MPSAADWKALDALKKRVVELKAFHAKLKAKSLSPLRKFKVSLHGRQIRVQAEMLRAMVEQEARRDSEAISEKRRVHVLHIERSAREAFEEMRATINRVMLREGWKSLSDAPQLVRDRLITAIVGFQKVVHSVTAAGSGSSSGSASSRSTSASQANRAALLRLRVTPADYRFISDMAVSRNAVTLENAMVRLHGLFRILRPVAYCMCAAQRLRQRRKLQLKVQHHLRAVALAKAKARATAAAAAKAYVIMIVVCLRIAQ